MKYLGIIIDEKFKWSNHVQHRSILIRKLFFIFLTLKYVPSTQILKMVYLPLAQSIISYGMYSYHS